MLQLDVHGGVHLDGRNTVDVEDFFCDSLQTLYDYKPVTFASAGASYTYIHPSKPIKIVVQTPDSDAANWSLHASSVWVASLELAKGVEFLRIEDCLQRVRFRAEPLRVLELGASAGIPSILIAKLYPDVSVLVTDYPDPHLIRTLRQNVKRNGVGTNCCGAPYAWGSDPTTLFSLGNKKSEDSDGFDVIVAADTLWNPDSHSIFIDTLRRTLRKDAGARVHLVAGLHTGRYTIDSFLRSAVAEGLHVVAVIEREVSTERIETRTRGWDVIRAEFEDEKDRRSWAIWIELCWEEYMSS